MPFSEAPKPAVEMPYLLIRFCILGSAVGGGAFVVARDLLGSHESAEIGKAAWAFVLDVPLWGTLASFLSIPFGFIPAAAACLAYWYILSRFTTTNPSALVRAAIGAAVGAAAAVSYGGALFASGAGSGGFPAGVNTWPWLVAGLVGGAVSALSARKATYEATFAKRNAPSGR
jgi:hypothetical protein